MDNEFIIDYQTVSILTSGKTERLIDQLVNDLSSWTNLSTNDVGTEKVRRELNILFTGDPKTSI